MGVFSKHKKGGRYRGPLTLLGILKLNPYCTHTFTVPCVVFPFTEAK